LEVPFYLEEDRQKTLWRVIKEGSLSMANLQRNIYLTESLLFDGQILTSTSLETFGKDLFDVKSLLLWNNDYISVIGKLHFKFPAKHHTIINKVEIVGASQESIEEYLSLSRKFNKIWKEDVLYDIAKQSILTVDPVEKEQYIPRSLGQPGSRFVHLIKVASKDPHKVRAAQHRLN